MAKVFIRTYDRRKKKDVVAGYIENGEYHKKVRSNHFMVKYNGYGIQTTILNDLIKLRIRKIVITTTKGTVLRSSTSDWVNKGQYADYGSGKQIFLNVKCMY